MCLKRSSATVGMRFVEPGGGTEPIGQPHHYRAEDQRERACAIASGQSAVRSRSDSAQARSRLVLGTGNDAVADRLGARHPVQPSAYDRRRRTF